MANDYQDYNNAESPYQVARDEREINVVKNIMEQNNISKTNMNDDSVEQDEMSKALAALAAQFNTLRQSESTLENTVSSISTTLGYVNTELAQLEGKKVFNLADILSAGEEAPTTTADFYDLLKSTLEEGNLCVGNIELSDGPSDESTIFGFLAYATENQITDGDYVYSRVYIILSSKAVAPYVWWYHLGEWRSIMILTDYKHFTLSSSTEGSTKKFWISVDDTGTISANEIVPVSEGN